MTPRSLKIFLSLLCFTVPNAVRAQTAAALPPALQIVNDVPAPGTVVPATQPPPAHAAPPGLPVAGVVQFPITEKTHSDTLNPAAPPSPPVPAPDVAASLISPAPVAPAMTVTVAAPRLATRLPPAKIVAAKAPPVPKPRPAIMAVSPAAAKAASLAAPAPVDTILTHRAAGPRMPTIRPASVEAEPLSDPLARQLLKPDKQELVKAIEAVAAHQPAPRQLAPSLPATVRTPAETLNPQAASPDVVQGDAARLVLPAQPGENSLSANTIAVLVSQAVPALRKDPTQELRIDAYASTISDEPLNARRIALTRALAIRAWLIDHGVAAHRIDLRAFGPEAGHSPADESEIFLLPPR